MRKKIEDLKTLTQSSFFEDFILSLKRKKDFYFIERFLKKFPKANIYFIGGGLRDILLAKKPSDFDFVIEGLEKKTILNFFQKEGKIKEIRARQFPAFKFTPAGSSSIIELSMPRKERQTGPFLDDFQIKTSPKIKIEEDLLRRDFTINALAFDFKKNELIDCFNGLSDLKKRLIRAVRDPKERFLEDPSRILRGIRLAVVLDFEIEKKTLKAMKEMKGEIIKKFKDRKGKLKKRVPEEIVGKEFLLAFTDNPKKTIKIWDELSLLSLLFWEVENLKGVEQPEEFHSEGDVYIHTLLCLENLKKEDALDLKLAVLFHDIGKPQTKGFNSKKNTISFYGHNKVGESLAEKIIERLKLQSFSKNSPLYINKEKILWLIRHHLLFTNAKPEEITTTAIKRYFLREDGWGDDLLKLIKADFLASLTPFKKPNLKKYFSFLRKIRKIKKNIREKKVLLKSLLSGKEIMEILDIQPGKVVGYLKDELISLQLEGRLKTKKEAKKILPNLYQSFKSLN